MIKILLLVAVAVAVQGMASAGDISSVHSIPLKDIDGKATSLGDFKGKVVLLVNVASKCGLTPQYKALQAIHEKYKDRGFTVIGVPSNDFAGQEPGTNEEIKKFCSSNYDVTFPLMDKVKVNGDGQHPLYTRLTGKNSEFPGDVEWNFGKFLIGADGKVLKRFAPRTAPDAPEITSAIEAALAK